MAYPPSCDRDVVSLPGTCVPHELSRIRRGEDLNEPCIWYARWDLNPQNLLGLNEAPLPFDHGRVVLQTPRNTAFERTGFAPQPCPARRTGARQAGRGLKPWILPTLVGVRLSMAAALDTARRPLVEDVRSSAVGFEDWSQQTASNCPYPLYGSGASPRLALLRNWLRVRESNSTFTFGL